MQTNGPPSDRFKKGDVAAKNPRAEDACERACRAHERVTDLVQRLTEDLDQITMPGVPVEIAEEDSLVTTVEAMLGKAAAGA